MSVCGPSQQRRVSLPTSSGESRAEQRKRQVQACDGCRSKKRRCDGIRPICTQCQKSRVREGETAVCTYVTMTKKRPNAGGGGPVTVQKQQLQHQQQHQIQQPHLQQQQLRQHQQQPDQRPDRADFTTTPSWDASAGASTTSTWGLDDPGFVDTLLSTDPIGIAPTLHPATAPATGFTTTFSPESITSQSSSPDMMQNATPSLDSPPSLDSFFPSPQSGTDRTQAAPVGPQVPVYTGLELGDQMQALGGNGGSNNNAGSNGGGNMALFPTNLHGDGLTPAIATQQSEAMFEDLDNLLDSISDNNNSSNNNSNNNNSTSRFIPTTSTPSPPFQPSRLWEVATDGCHAAAQDTYLGVTDFNLTLDGAAYQSLNMDSNMYFSLLSSQHFTTQLQHTHNTNIPDIDLHTHLMELGTVSEACLPYGPVPQSDRVHPGVRNVLYALGAQISNHPELYKQYGTRQSAVKYFAARSEDAFSDRGQDTPATVQGMLMLGAVFYKLDNGRKACKWIVEACNVCEYMCYNRTSTNPVIAKSSLSQPDEAPLPHMQVQQDLFALERDIRWNVYAMAIEHDTFCALASTFAFVIDETDVPHMLYERRPWESTRNEQLERDEKDRERRMKIRHTGLSIFEDQITAHAAHQLNRAIYQINPSQDTALNMQVAFLLRRVMRFLRAPYLDRPDVDEGHVGRGAAAVLALVPPETDPALLHESLMIWYLALPPQMRMFESLVKFRDATTAPAPPSSASAPPNKPPGGVGSLHLMFIYLLSLSLLHDNLCNPSRPEHHPLHHAHHKQRNERAAQSNQPQRPLYRIDSRTSHPIRAASRQILTVARRALAYILRSVHLVPPRPAPLVVDPHTYPQENASIPFMSTHPAPPPQIGILPMAGLGVLLVVQAELNNLLAATTHNNDNQVDDPAEPAATAILVEDAIADCRDIFLPVLDNLARFAPVNMNYAFQIRALCQMLRGGAEATATAGALACLASDVGIWAGTLIGVGYMPTYPDCPGKKGMPPMPVRISRA
ncbi:hypothetical protein DFJ77DRAFT_340892 [Powellomyces hirtus]|nr:hypothetical protein DFJ77DRAFT_340892 [Powellomyces hirtus]